MEGVNIGIWGWVWVVVFLFIFVGMGAYGMSKTKTEEDFAVARGSYGPFMLAFAFAATIASGATFMSLPGMAYSKGFAVLWYPAVYPIAIYLGMFLAIKLIKPERNSDELIARFDSERQALALMNHPNIATVYDAGVTELAIGLYDRPEDAMRVIAERVMPALPSWQASMRSSRLS